MSIYDEHHAAMEAHTIALRAVEAEMRRQTDLAARWYDAGPGVTTTKFIAGRAVGPVRPPGQPSAPLLLVRAHGWPPGRLVRRAEEPMTHAKNPAMRHPTHRIVKVIDYEPWLLGWCRWEITTELHYCCGGTVTNALAKGRWKWRGRKARCREFYFEGGPYWKGPPVSGL